LHLSDFGLFSGKQAKNESSTSLLKGRLAVRVSFPNLACVVTCPSDMPSLPLLLFYVFAVLAVGGGMWLLLSKNLLHMAFALLLTLLGLAAIYVLLFADFVAVAQIMVYVGGVLVLILFGLLLSSNATGNFVAQEPVNRWTGLLLAMALLGGGLWALAQSFSQAFGQYPAVPALAQKAAQGQYTSLHALGRELISSYVLPFEIASVLLLVALVGAAAITKQTARK
jgi:NADH-quinone oxidoreductase subunit J